MRQNGATCRGQCEAHFEVVTWKLSQFVALLQQDLFCYLSSCFDSRASCFDISIERPEKAVGGHFEATWNASAVHQHFENVPRKLKPKAASELPS